MLLFLLEWALFIVPLFLLFLAVSNEVSAWAILISLAAVIVWYFAGIWDFAWVMAHWGGIFVTAVGYLVGGAIWSVFNWYDTYRVAVNEFKANKETAAKERWAKKSDADKASQTYQQWVQENYLPVYTDNKERITIWILWWPFSILAKVVGDWVFRVVKKVVTTIYNWLADTYNRISNHLVKDLTP